MLFRSRRVERRALVLVPEHAEQLLGHVARLAVAEVELHRAAEPWLALPIQLQALGVSWRVARQDLPAFEAATGRALGQPYQVFDRPPASGAAPGTPGDEVMAIAMIEPAAGNRAALGVNALSIPAAREAMIAQAVWFAVMALTLAAPLLAKE